MGGVANIWFARKRVPPRDVKRWRSRCRLEQGGVKDAGRSGLSITVAVLAIDLRLFGPYQETNQKKEGRKREKGKANLTE